MRRARQGEAFTVVDGDGGRVLMPVVIGQDTAVVRTSVPADVLRAGVTRAWLGIVGLGLVLMGLAGAVALRIGRRISEPLLGVAGVAHRLREGDLSARAEVAGTEETEELARALNGLAERTDELLVAERAAVGRPLPPAADAGDRAAAGRRGGRRPRARPSGWASTSRVLQRSIDAIVQEARRPVRTDLRACCDATAVVARPGGLLAGARRRPGASRWRSSVPDAPLRVPVAADDLADVVDVLVDNVFAHTPERDRLRGQARGRATGRPALAVTDDGPGPRARERRDRQGSTGLGLDIARRTAIGCGGSLTFGRAAEGGLSVEVTLPLVRGLTARQSSAPGPGRGCRRVCDLVCRVRAGRGSSSSSLPWSAVVVIVVVAGVVVVRVVALAAVVVPARARSARRCGRRCGRGGRRARRRLRRDRGDRGRRLRRAP